MWGWGEIVKYKTKCDKMWDGWYADIKVAWTKCYWSTVAVGRRTDFAEPGRTIWKNTQK